MTNEEIENIIDRLIWSNQALEYIAFNYNESKLENLPLGMSESTCPADSALLEVRRNKRLIDILHEKVYK